LRDGTMLGGKAAGRERELYIPSPTQWEREGPIA